MPANPELPDRRFPRKKDFDYSSAAIYFVTICTREKRTLFGRIAGSQMLPNRFGKIVQETWHELPDHYPRVNLVCFTLMPNHIHGVLALADQPMNRSLAREIGAPVAAGLKRDETRWRMDGNRSRHAREVGDAGGSETRPYNLISSATPDESYGLGNQWSVLTGQSSRLAAKF